MLWTCANCEAPLAPAADNYKDFLACIETRPHEVDPVMYADSRDFCDDDLVLREYICPHCAHLVATDIARAQDEPVTDMKLYALPGATAGAPESH
jgi:hypothetical protein